MYDLDELQAQFEKVQHTANRLQAEKEDFHLDLERNREKCDKLQVSYLLIIIVKKKSRHYFLFIHNHQFFYATTRENPIPVNLNSTEVNKAMSFFLSRKILDLSR